MGNWHPIRFDFILRKAFMKKHKIKNFTKGWFIGDFEPSLLQTKHFEVGVKYYKAGDTEDCHMHKTATEYTVIVKGKIMMFNKVFKKGDIIEVEPNEYTDFVALKDTITLVVKTPSVKGDKYLVEINK